jgi:signal transduction histidine kinase
MIIIRNMVSNSLKFTGPGGIIELGTEITEEKNILEIFVSDNGTGISEEKLSAILSGNKYESSYGTEREKGTGIGLNLCFDLVKLIDGTIHISSDPGKGTKVTIRLPV